MASVDTKTNEAAIADAWHGLQNAGEWVVVGLEGPNNTLVIEGQGSGGIEELRSQLDSNKVQWGAICVSALETFSGVETRNRNRVTFSFSGKNVGAVRKSQLAQHKGAVKDEVEALLSLTFTYSSPQTNRFLVK